MREVVIVLILVVILVFSGRLFAKVTTDDGIKLAIGGGKQEEAFTSDVNYLRDRLRNYYPRPMNPLTDILRFEGTRGSRHIYDSHQVLDTTAQVDRYGFNSLVGNEARKSIGLMEGAQWYLRDKPSYEYDPTTFWISYNNLDVNEYVG